MKTLQRLAGKCVSFSLVVPAAKLFTQAMNAAISRGQRINANHAKLLPLTGKLKDEIGHWLFLEGWDDPLPLREERHVRGVIATDASNSGWGGSILAPFSGYICLRLLDQRPASLRDLNKGSDSYRQSVDIFCAAVTKYKSRRASGQNAVVDAWNNQRGRSSEFNAALKALFFTTARLHISLHLSDIPSGEDPADAPSRRFPVFNNRLSRQIWNCVQEEFGGDKDILAILCP